MAEKVIVVIHDDWEVRGNGLGNVAQMQYLPALFLMRHAKRLGFRVTFTVETMQQIAFRQFADVDTDLRLQSRIWDDMVAMMVADGFDVQLHIHPHWYNAKFENGFFHVSSRWNLAAYPSEQRREIVQTAAAFLRDAVKRGNPEHAICCYKAGSYGMQPSAGLLEDLADAGIEIVLGVQKNMVLRAKDLVIDYSGLEEDTLPYYPRKDDIAKVSDGVERLVVVPVAHYTAGIYDNLLRAGAVVRERLTRGTLDAMPYYTDVPCELVANNPLKEARRTPPLNRLLSTSYNHIDLGSGQTFLEWKRALDQIMDRLMRHPSRVVPFIIESHSKDFQSRWRPIVQFFEYLLARYGRTIEIDTLAGLGRRIRSGDVPVAAKCAR